MPLPWPSAASRGETPSLLLANLPAWWRLLTRGDSPSLLSATLPAWTPPLRTQKPSFSRAPRFPKTLGRYINTTLVRGLPAWRSGPRFGVPGKCRSRRWVLEHPKAHGDPMGLWERVGPWGPMRPWGPGGIHGKWVSWVPWSHENHGFRERRRSPELFIIKIFI